MASASQIPLKVLDVEAVTHPVIASIADYWCALNGGRPPARKDFDFMQIYKAAPHLLLAERIAPLTFKFVYCGTAVANNFPRDLTGAVYGPNTVRVSGIRWPTIFCDVLDGPVLEYGRERMDWPNDEYSDIIYGAFPMLAPTGLASYVLACLIFMPRSPFDPRPPV